MKGAPLLSSINLKREKFLDGVNLCKARHSTACVVRALASMLCVTACRTVGGPALSERLVARNPCTEPHANQVAASGLVPELVPVLFLLGTYLALVLPRIGANRFPVGDQSSYLAMAASLRLNGHFGVGFSYLYPERGWYFPQASYMPMTALLISPIASRDPDFFLRAKLAIAGFGGLGILVIYLLALNHGRLWAMLTAALLCTNAAYLGLAAHVLPDALFASMLAAIAILAHRTPFPPPSHAFRLGLLTGLAWLTKATALVVGASLAFAAIGSAPVRTVAKLWLALVLGFVLLAAPYMTRNVILFGNPIYDDNTAHLIWLDAWRKPEGGGYYPRAATDRPSMRRFLAQYGYSGLLKRTAAGIRPTFLTLTRSLLPAGLRPSRLTRWVCFFLAGALVFLGIKYAGFSYAAKASLLAVSAITLGIAAVGNVVSFHVRFALPVFALLLPFLAEGLRAVLSAFVPRAIVCLCAHRLLPLLLVPLWIWVGVCASRTARTMACPLPESEAYAISFLSSHLPPDARVYVTSRIGCWRYLYDKPTLEAPYFNSLADVTRFADKYGITYWVIDKGAKSRHPALHRLPSEHTGWRLIAQCRDPDDAMTVLIYKRVSSRKGTENDSRLTLSRPTITALASVAPHRARLPLTAGGSNASL
jgi:hypothetical protein